MTFGGFFEKVTGILAGLFLLVTGSHSSTQLSFVAPSSSDYFASSSVTESPDIPSPYTITSLPVDFASATTTGNPVAAAVTTPTDDSPATTTPDALSTDVLNTKTRTALVNIRCWSDFGGPLQNLTAGGVIISPQGVVLTTAAIGKEFLLRDFLPAGATPLHCDILAGSPATKSSYTARLLFFPPRWVDLNANIDVAQTSSTPQWDYALLLLTDSAGQTKSFPYVTPVIPDAINIGDPIFVATYPVGVVGSTLAQQNLFITSSLAKVHELALTAGKPYFFSASHTITSQPRNTGGVIVRTTDGGLLGLIIGQVGNEYDGALSTSYLSDSLQYQTGLDLNAFLKQDLQHVADTFSASQGAVLAKPLIDVLIDQQKNGKTFF